MKWTSFPSIAAAKSLAGFARDLKNTDCIAHFSADESGNWIKVFAMPHWSVQVKRRKSRPGREVIRFLDITQLSTSNLDNMVHGEFKALTPDHCEGGAMWKFVVTDLGGDLQSMQFAFARCELDLGFAKAKTKRGRAGERSIRRMYRSGRLP